VVSALTTLSKYRLGVVFFCEQVDEKQPYHAFYIRHKEAAAKKQMLGSAFVIRLRKNTWAVLIAA